MTTFDDLRAGFARWSRVTGATARNQRQLAWWLARHGCGYRAPSLQWGFSLGEDVMHGPGLWRFSLSWDPVPEEHREEGFHIHRRQIEVVWRWLPVINWEYLVDGCLGSHRPPVFWSCLWTGRRRQVWRFDWPVKIWWR